jgi:nitronate monooxygenase
VRTPWLDKYLRIEDRMKRAAHAKTHCTMWFDCLSQCGLRDGHADWGQFCIDKVLGYAFEGDVRRGLFFRGAGRLPFGDQIRPVQDLLHWLLGNLLPPTTTEAQA